MCRLLLYFSGRLSSSKREFQYLTISRHAVRHIILSLPFVFSLLLFAVRSLTFDQDQLHPKQFSPMLFLVTYIAFSSPKILRPGMWTFH